MNINFYLSICLSIFLVACGGGGGGGGSEPPTPTTPAPTISFSANPTSVLLGTNSTLTWSSSNATSCSASGNWSGSRSTSGSETVTINGIGNNSFTLSCSGGGGSRSATVTVEGFRQTDGVVVDGYISGADVFIDQNDNFISDASENTTTSDNEGKFTIKYNDGNLVSIGGTDLDSQTLLDNLLITHKLSGHSEFKAITPVTSVAAFMNDPSNINTALGIDSSLDIYVTDPVANKGDAGIYDYLYEKGNQLTVLAYAIQNISNDLNVSTDTTEDYFKGISEELENLYNESGSKVDIETSAFIEKVFDNITAAKSLNISENSKNNSITALASVLPIIQVKSDPNITTSIIRFGVSKLQQDIILLANGSASQELINNYTQNVTSYIAENENISESDLIPDITSFDDLASTDEDTPLNIFILENDSYVAGNPFLINPTNPSNGSIQIIDRYILYTPNQDFNGSDQFSYTLSQGDKASNATVSIDVLPVNDTPSIDIASTIQVYENQTNVTTVSVSDVDEDELTLTLTDDLDGASFNLSESNVLTFIEAPDYETKTSYQITLSLTDNIETVTKDVTIEILDLNDGGPIFISNSTFSVDENTKVIGQVTAEDPEGETVIYSISGSDIIIAESGAISFIESPDFETKNVYTATVTASDGTISNTQDITVNINNLNDNSPDITSPNQFFADENQTAIGTITATDADGDTLEFSVSSEVVQIDSSSGELTFVNPPNWEETSAFSYNVTVSDGTFLVSQQISIIINNLNEFSPTIEISGPFTVNEYVLGDSDYKQVEGNIRIDDEDRGDLSVTISNTDLVFNPGGSNTYGCSGGTCELKLYGKFLDTFDYETKSSWVETLTVTDEDFTTVEEIVISVNNLNDNSPSITSSATFSADENQLDIGRIEATDADGDDLSYSISSGGEITINPTSGFMRFASIPDYETQSSYSASVTVSDGSFSTTQDITVNVNNLDNENAPVITSSSIFSADENQTNIGTVFATDADGDDLTFSISGSEITITGSTASEENGDWPALLSFVSAPDYETKSSYTATITVSDGTYSSSQDITVNINDIDENPPILSNLTATPSTVDVTTESKTITLSITASDETGVDVSQFLSKPQISKLGSPSISADANWALVSGDNKNGTYQATITISTDAAVGDYLINAGFIYDLKGNDARLVTDYGAANGGVTINSSQEGDPPVLSNLTATPSTIDITSGAQSITLSISATDASGVDVSQFLSKPQITSQGGTSISANANWSLVSGDDKDGTYQAIVGIPSTTPVGDYLINSGFIYDIFGNSAVEVSDYGASNGGITIKTNSSPVITSSSSYNADENQTAIGTVTATDADGDTVTFTISGSEISIDSSTGALTFASAPDYETKSTYTATVTASDGIASVTQNITVTVNNLNDNSPAINSSATFNADENQTNIGTVSATDADGDDVSFSVEGENLNIDSNSGVLNFINAPDYETQSTYTGTVSVSDGVNTSTQNITINIIDIDENTNTPVITSSASFSADENQSAIGTVTATDADGDSLTFTISGSEISIGASTGVLSFISLPDYEAKSSYAATVTVTDGKLSTSQNISVSINNLNDNSPLISSSANFSADENQTAIGTVAASDADGDGIIFSISGSDISINSSSGVISFISPPDYETKSSYVATVTASDGSLSSSQNITVAINNLNDNSPEITSNSTFSVEENKTDIGNVEASDADGDSISFTIDNDVQQKIEVSVAANDDGPGNVYVIRGIQNKPLTLKIGKTYKFEHPSGHPLRFSTTSDGIHSGGSEFTDGVDTSQNGVTIITVSASTPADLYYYCRIHSGMGGAITASSATFPELTISEAGALSINPVADFETLASYSALISASDGTNITNQNIQVNVTDIDQEGPTFNSSSSFAVDENSTAVGTVSADDPFGSSVSYSLSGTDAESLNIDSDSGVLEFKTAPDFETKTSYQIIVTATGSAASTDQNVTITINNLNDNSPSITSSATFSADENQTSIGTIVAEDADGDSLTYSLSSNDILIDPSSGLMVFSSSPDYETTTSFSGIVSVSDGVNTKTQVITVNINNLNDNDPVFTSSSTFSVNENEISVATITASDADGDEITFAVSGSDLSITSSGVLTFVSAPDYENQSTYSATITASDSANSAQQTINISIININEAPVFTSNTTITADENQTSIATVAASDPEGDSISFSISGSEILVDSNSGVLTFVSAPDYETKSSYTATVTASDGSESNSQNITVNINNLNDNAPVISSSATFNIDENQASIGSIAATDADGDDITYSVNSDDISINSTTGAIAFISAPDYETQSSYTASVTASDGSLSDTQNISISINNLNDNAPNISSSATFNVNEGETSIGSISASDADGDTISYEITGTSEITINETNGALNFTSAPDFESKTTYSATINVSDGSNITSQAITVNINDLNDNSITITDPNCDTKLSQCASINLNENDPDFTYQVVVEDADPTRDLRYELYCPNQNQCGAGNWSISQSGLISIALSGGFDYEAIPEQNITTGTGIRVYDDLAGPLSGESDTTYAKFNVLNVQEAVVLDSDQSCTHPENASDTITNRCDFDNKTDPDCTPYVNCGATYTWSFADEGLDGNHNYFNLDSSNGIITFKSAFDYEDPQDLDSNFTIDGDNVYEFDISVSDGTFTSTQEVKVIITDVNDVAPVAYFIQPTSMLNPQNILSEPWTFDAFENDRLVGYFYFSDPDGASGNGYSFSVNGESSVSCQGRGNSSNAYCEFSIGSSGADFETKSSYSFTVTVNDGVQSYTTSTVTINITNRNDNSPVITSSDTFSVNENQTSIGTVTATDADGDPISFTLSGTDASSVNIDSSSGALTFVSAPDYETKTSYSITVTASDSGGSSFGGSNNTSQNITININDLNDNSPVITSSDTFSVNENQTSIGTVTATDSDGDTITYSISGSDISINSSSGVIAFNSAPNYESTNSYSATVSASDGTNTTTQNITVNINDINDAPVTTSKAYWARLQPQSQTTTTWTLEGVSDEDGDTLTYSIVSNGTHGTASVNSSSGVVSYVTAASTQSTVTDTFTYKVNDGTSDSNTATITLESRTDPLYQYQWHLNNTGQTNFATDGGTSGVDLNVDTVIASGIRGDGVKVAVVDDGLEIAHEDLVNNVISGSWDFVNSDTDPTLPSPCEDESDCGGHGTSVGGIIAAEGWNKKGVRGIAPDASIFGNNFLEKQVADDGSPNEAKALGVNYPGNVTADIYNMSYGVGYVSGSTSFSPQIFLTSASEAKFVNGVENLRNGKGALYIKSSGNDYGTASVSGRCGDGEPLSCTESYADSTNQSPYVLTIGALRADGIKSSYSTPGSSLWVSGFGGEYGYDSDIFSGYTGVSDDTAIMTIDRSSCSLGYSRSGSNDLYGRNKFNLAGQSYTEQTTLNPNCNYNSHFNGTSAAAPTISGVIALMLEANPSLTWRDVKHILVTTSSKVDASRAHTQQGISQYEWIENSAGYEHHNWYGFGVVNADAAVTAAQSYTANSRGTWASTGYQATGTLNINMPDLTIVDNTIAVTKPSGSNDFVEFVRVSIQYSHSIPASIGVRLTSPDGTVLNLVQPYTKSSYSGSYMFDIGVSGFYGESIEGNWKIDFADYVSDGTTGSLTEWGIEVWGN